MSLQQTDQPPPLVYPISEPNPPSHHHSDGSFTAVFIVLAVILVVSAIACILGRLCNKRYTKSNPSMHGRRTKGKRNTFQTKDGDIEFGYDKRFSSAKVAANGDPNMGPDMDQPNSSHEPNMGPDMGRPNLFHEPNMGPDMGRSHSFHEPNMGPDMGRTHSFHEPNMGPEMRRPNLFREPNMGPSLGRPNSVREPSMGRPDSFQEPSTGRPNMFRKVEFRDDEMKFNSGTGPQYY